MKLKSFTRAIFLITIVFSWLIPVNTAEAVPAFARQMSVPCGGCHFQYIPKLNSFGREFKLGGFTQTAQELIEDMKFSLPPVLNASFVAKLTYDKRKLSTDTTPEKMGKERGETSIPAVGVIFLGGRVNENIGALVEFKAGAESFKFVYSKDFGGFQGGLSIFTTEEMGPAHGMEGWNTGLQMHIQPGLNMMQSSAQSIITMGAPEASGITFFGSADMFFVAFGMWAPFHEGFTDAGTDLSTYYRVALTPSVGEWDAMIGIAGSSGSTKCVDCGVGGTTETEYKTNVSAINAQLQGDVRGMSLGVYADIVLDTGGDNDNVFNTTMTMGGMSMRSEKQTSWALQADLGVTMWLGLHAGYKSHSFESRNAATDMKMADRDVTATTLGLWYKIKQNVLFLVDYTTYGGDKLIMTSTGNMGAVDNDLMAAIKMGF